MKQGILEEIDSSILDICVHPLVENGTFDAQNTDHMCLLIESLAEKNFTETMVAEVVKALRHEGKYPDRQAFNKEGWLVTFPSKEYRDAAIKKGTHSVSDPTHGKGGMNLYYKKKGKQKRVTQQATSQSDLPSADQPKGVSSPTPQKQKEPSAAVTPPSSQEKTPTGKPSPASSEKPSAEKPMPSEPEIGGDSEKATSAASTTDTGEPSAVADKGEVSPEKIDGEAPVSEPTPSIQPKSEITVQFAKDKGWVPTPYGEWRDSSGTTVAVVSLSGEVAPLKSNDREELKLFADKLG